MSNPKGMTSLSVIDKLEEGKGNAPILVRFNLPKEKGEQEKWLYGKITEIHNDPEGAIMIVEDISEELKTKKAEKIT